VAPPAAAGSSQAGEAVSFRVVMRRGGREDRTRELQIPVTAGMAAHLRQKEEREAAEKAELKRLVLEANKRDLQVGLGGAVCGQPDAL
jgi:regulator of nonsense transcripts 2